MPKKALVGIVILAVIILAGYFYLHRKPVDSDSLNVSGTIEVTSVALSFKIGGRMTERLVDEGQIVRTGQLIARLEDDELKHERDGRAAEELASRAQVADLEAGSRREEIAQGEAALARIRADAKRLSQDALRAEALFEREVIARNELDAARAARDSSTAAVHEAEQRLKLLRSGPRPDAVRQARARVEGAAAGKALAETRLTQSILNSPLSGLVLAKHAEPGEMLAPGAPVVTIGKLDQVWLRAYIPESELGRVKVGQSARVSVDGWPGRSFDGKISFISPEAEFTPKNVQTAKERVKLVYRIKITLDNPKMELKPGMPADAVIDLMQNK
jgi:HlyD family secretion protein